MKLRVLQLVTTYQSVVTILNSKLQLLDSVESIDLTVGSTFEPDEQRTTQVDYFNVYIDRKISIVKDLQAIWKVYCFIRKNKIDIVHTHTAKAGIVGAAAALLGRVPSVHTYHGLPFYKGQSFAAYWLYLTIETLFSYIRKITFSQNVSDFKLLENKKIWGANVILEGNGVDMDYVNREAILENEPVDVLVKNKGVILLCVARFEHVKHLDTIITTVEWLNSKGNNIHCILAGKGELENAIRQQIKNRNLERLISIVYTPHIFRLLYKSDIVLLSSEKEGLPRCILEAMALSKPVVATDVMGTREVVVNNETGLLVPFGDQSAFNNAVSQLINDKELCRRLGENGKKRVLELYNEKKIVDLWVEYYRKLCTARYSCHN